VTIKEIEAKSILRKHKKIDSWFISHYGLNLYRGCTHNCSYCDGRSERYYVDGEFGEDVSVKVNAIDILRRELDPKRKRVPFKRSFMILGGGVGDSYQPIEKRYQLSRKALQLFYEYKFPVHVLTKSNLIMRDIDILKKINDRSRAVVSYSFSCGMFLLPVIPFITDKPELMEETIKRASHVGIDFIIFGGMTLKDGKQKDYFSNVLNRHFPELTTEYVNIYRGNKWGAAIKEYYESINQVYHTIMEKYNIPARMPLHLFKDILEQKDLVIVILEHIDYLLKLEGKTSPFGYAAYSISQSKEPLSTLRGDLRRLKGVGKTTEWIILEILETGTSSYYEKLLG
jgi:DNA repair photolyase